MTRASRSAIRYRCRPRALRLERRATAAAPESLGSRRQTSPMPSQSRRGSVSASLDSAAFAAPHFVTFFLSKSKRGKDGAEVIMGSSAAVWRGGDTNEAGDLVGADAGKHATSSTAK